MEPDADEALSRDLKTVLTIHEDTGDTCHRDLAAPL